MGRRGGGAAGPRRTVPALLFPPEVAPNISDLFHDARALVRAAEDRQKPSAERLPEYADSRLPRLRAELLANAPVHKPLDALFLEFRLSKAREYLTADAPETQLMLGKDSPDTLAARLVNGSHLDDAAVRRKLWDGGWADYSSLGRSG